MTYRMWLRPGFLILAVVMASPSIGCFRRRIWGWRQAIADWATPGRFLSVICLRAVSASLSLAPSFSVCRDPRHAKYLRKAQIFSGQDLLTSRRYLTCPRRRSSGVIVNPCANTENATTAKVITTMTSRRGKSSGRDNDSASAKAPRSPPQKSTC